MSSSRPYTIGVDVGGTNTDAVILKDGKVLTWYKSPTTTDIQSGVEDVINAVINKAGIAAHSVASVKIGTTMEQFVNAVLEQNAKKLDRVAVIRLSGPYTKGSPPFLDFPQTLRKLLEGHVGYVEGGFEVDGRPISSLIPSEIKEQATIIREKDLRSVLVVGVYSPQDPSQELEARLILQNELGPEYDISCSYSVGQLGFIERENASILNASLRRFARQVISGFQRAVRSIGAGNLYISLNDGTLSKTADAAESPVRCFSSGPTNSARGAALLAGRWADFSGENGREVLVIDVGGTTTDICALLPTGYPRQTAAFAKVAGVRTNFVMPYVHSMALGGGSIIRTLKDGSMTVGPDSVGARLGVEAISFGGRTLTTSDLVMSLSGDNSLTAAKTRHEGLLNVQHAIEVAIDLVKTKAGDAIAFLVGGGSIIVGDKLKGISEVVKPEFSNVANAVGAAIGKICGSVDITVVPNGRPMEELVAEAVDQAREKCSASGGDKMNSEVIELETIPVSYVTNGAMRIIIRVVAELVGYDQEDLITDTDLTNREWIESQNEEPVVTDIEIPFEYINTKLTAREIGLYKPRIEEDFWYLSEVDLNFLIDGTGVLGVGSCGEPYATYLACLETIKCGGDIKIQAQSMIADNAIVMCVGFIGAPSVYLERVPGLHEIKEAVQAVVQATNTPDFDAVIPNEIGGLNAFEALLVASRLNKAALDTDCVGRAYPWVWQTVRCLQEIPIVPSAVAKGDGNSKIFMQAKDEQNAEDLMREACIDFGSLAGMCVSPITGKQARSMPKNSYSHAWYIGRSIAIARAKKIDVVDAILEIQSGTRLFSGKIISITRKVEDGFTRGTVTLEAGATENLTETQHSMSIVFENENLYAIRHTKHMKDEIIASCPDLITLLDAANGSPLGIPDYKYGLRVYVIALPAPAIWTSEEGLEKGGPKAFGLDISYKRLETSTREQLSVFQLCDTSQEK